MNADDFQDLYKLLRGSKSAFGVLDARTLFLEKKMQAALAKIVDSRESYSTSRTRLMKQDAKKQVDAKAKDAERQIKRIERKQEKVREILKKFDEMMPALEKLAAKEHEKESAQQQGAAVHDDGGVAIEPQTGVRPVTPKDVSVEFAARFIETEGDKQLELISGNFGFQPIESEEDIFPNSVYFIRIQNESFLVHTRGQDEMGDDVPLVSVVDEMPMKTYTRDAFVRLGTRRRMVLLTTTKAESDSYPDSIDLLDDPSEAIPNGETYAENLSETIDNFEPGKEKDPDAGLDTDDFSQLMESAQRSGLVPNVQQIAHYRDREFRLACYDMAFAGIEGIFANFTAAAKELKQRLASEEQAAESGEMKISPEEIKAKLAQNRQTIQAVEEARSKFQHVIDGLQVLMREQA